MPAVAAIVPLRFALTFDLMILFGLPLFGLYAPERGARGSAFAFRGWTLSAGCAGVILSIAAMLAMIAGMAGQSIAALDRATVEAILSQTAIGYAFFARIAALGVALLATLLLPTRPAITGIAAGIAVSTLAWTGHGAMDEGAAGWVHLIADIAHFLAAGVWMGALVALSRLVWRDLRDPTQRSRAAQALQAFGPIGMAVVAVLIVSGAANGWFLLLWSGEPLLPLNPYRTLLVLKLIAFGAMLALAGLNRWMFVPRIARGGRAIRISVAIETLLGLAVLALVAILGTLPPNG